MMGVLEESMEPDLKADNSSNMEDIPTHQHSTIMIFYLIAKHIFARNQEAKDTMKNYLINFDMRNFDAKNISKAIINVKVITRALVDDLSSNVVRCILIGFGEALNKVSREKSPSALLCSGSVTPCAKTLCSP